MKTSQPTAAQKFIKRKERWYYYDDENKETIVDVVLETVPGYPRAARRVLSARTEDGRLVKFHADGTALTANGRKLQKTSSS